MNIGGFGYAPVTQAMRNSSNGSFQNQHFRLMFVYPMLFDDSVKFLEKDIRDFLANTMMKEILTSNFLNFVDMASQIFPVSDNRGQYLDTGGLTSRIRYNLDGGVINHQSPTYTDPMYKHEVRQKLAEKTETIKQLLSIDPKFKSYDPHIEIVTMNNMIDVPVIIGTNKLDIDSVVVAMMLIVALTQNKKLNNQTDVETIFKIIRVLDTNKIHTLFNNMVFQKKTTSERIQGWLEEKKYTRAITNKVMNTLKIRKSDDKYAARTNKFKEKLDKATGTIDLDYPTTMTADKIKSSFNHDLLPQDVGMVMMNLLRDNIQMTELYFKFVTDPALLKSRYGLENRSQSSQTFTKFSAEIDGIVNQSMSNFISNFRDSVLPIIDTSIRIFRSQDDITPSQEFVNEHINNNLFNKIATIITSEFATKFKNNLSNSSANNSKDIITKMKANCVNGKAILHDAMSLTSKLAGLTHTDLNAYINSMHTLTRDANNIAKECENNLRPILEGETGTIINNWKIQLSIEFKNLFEKLSMAYDSSVPNAFWGLPSHVVIETQKAIVADLTDLTMYAILYTLQSTLCDLITTIEINIDAAASDVTSLPNYVLVLPVETIYAVYHAFYAKTYKDMVEQLKFNPASDMSKFTQLYKELRELNDNYVKSVVKVVVNKLEVPNIFVYDKKKDDIYYKLMNMTDVNKIKLSALRTFSENMKNRQLPQLANNY